MRRAVAATALALVTIVGTSGAAYASSYTENVGGGTWVHGTSYSFPATKNAWSNYQHQSKVHSATVVGGNGDRSFSKQSAGTWANTEIHVGLSDPVHAYWNVY